MSKDIKEFLKSYSPEVRKLTLKARALILEIIPNAIEQVDLPSKIIAYGCGRKMSDIICVIAPYTSHVNIIFSKGTVLPDPAGLLEGTGKYARHAKITKVEDIEAPALRKLLNAAVAKMKLEPGDSIQ